LNSIKKEQVFIDIPFYGKPTEVSGKRLINLAKSLNPNINIQPSRRLLPSLSKYFPIKDPIPNERQSNILYKINFTECEASYMGKTECQAIRRFQEHGTNLKIEKPTKNKPLKTNKIIDNLRRSERNKGKNVKYYPEINEEDNSDSVIKDSQSAIMKHASNSNHKIDWNNWNIITKDKKQQYRLLIKESLAIFKYQPLFNKTVCSVPLIIYLEGLKAKKPKVKIKSMIDALPSGAEWAEIGDQKQFPVAKLLLNQDNVLYVGSNEL